MYTLDIVFFYSLDAEIGGKPSIRKKYCVFLVYIPTLCENYVYIFNLGMYILGMYILGMYILDMHILSMYELGIHILDIYILDMHNFEQNVRIWGMVPEHMGVPFVCARVCMRVCAHVRVRVRVRVPRDLGLDYWTWLVGASTYLLTLPGIHLRQV
jgi:hypothetical protein